MKKIILLTLTFLLLTLTINLKPCFNSLIKKSYYINNTGVYIFYCLDSYSEIDNAKVIKNGNSSIIKTDFKNAMNVKKSLNNILGESVSFKGTLLDFLKIQNDFDFAYSFQENMDNGIVNVYGYSNLKDYSLRSINIDNQKINIQLSYNCGTITIGNPIILGSY